MAVEIRRTDKVRRYEQGAEALPKKLPEKKRLDTYATAADCSLPKATGFVSTARYCVPVRSDGKRRDEPPPTDQGIQWLLADLVTLGDEQEADRMGLQGKPRFDFMGRSRELRAIFNPHGGIGKAV